MHQAQVDAELGFLQVLGIGVYPTSTLDGKDPQWLPRQRALLVGTDLTADEAEDLVCDVLGLVTELLAEPAS